MKGSLLADSSPHHNRTDFTPSGEDGHSLLAFKEPSGRFSNSGRSFLPICTIFVFGQCLGWGCSSLRLVQLSPSWSKQALSPHSLHNQTVKSYSRKERKKTMSLPQCVWECVLTSQRKSESLTSQRRVNIKAKRRGFFSNHSGAVLFIEMWSSSMVNLMMISTRFEEFTIIQTYFFLTFS